MTYAQQLESALNELDKSSELIARKQVFRNISIRQQMDTISIALNAKQLN